MVQQQFIISELSNESEHSSEQESILLQKQFEKAQEELEVPEGHPGEEEGKKKNNIDQDLPVPYSRGFGVNKISFAIFGSFKSQFVMSDELNYKKYIAASQSSFRVMGMVIPDYSIILTTLLSCEGFQEEASELQSVILYYFKLFAESSELKIIPHYRDYWSICKIARTYALKYLNENFIPLKLDYGEKEEKESEEIVEEKEELEEEKESRGSNGSKISKESKDGKSIAKGNYTLFDRELKLKQTEIRKQVGLHVVKEALEVWTRNKYRGAFLLKYMGMDGDPEEKFDY